MGIKNRRLVEGSFWDRVLDMFAQSIIVQSLITMVLVMTLCAMWVYSLVAGLDPAVAIPGTLVQFTLLVLGFWFGKKAQVSNSTNVQTMAKLLEDFVKAKEGEE